MHKNIVASFQEFYNLNINFSIWDIIMLFENHFKNSYFSLYSSKYHVLLLYLQETAF